MAGIKRPPLSEGEKVLFGRIERLILGEGLTYTEAAERLGMSFGRVKGFIRRWELQTGGNFTERNIEASADRYAAWVHGGKIGPRPKMNLRFGKTEYGFLIACLERGVLVAVQSQEPYPPSTAAAARKYAETYLRPEERERMFGLINYHAAMHVTQAAEDIKEALRAEAKDAEPHKGPKGIRRIRRWS